MIEAETETAESPIKKAGQMVLTMGSTSPWEGCQKGKAAKGKVGSLATFPKEEECQDLE